MFGDNFRETEKKVLEVYKEANPSTYYIEKDRKEFERVRQYAYRLYVHSLKILPRAFKDAKLLEFGPGTGERSINYLLWGANCTFVDMNQEALERARKLFDQFLPDANYKLVHSFFSSFESDELYDFTISNGVIHHTADKEKAFKKQVSYMKPGGINVLGIGNTGGYIQRNLQRFIVYTYAGRDIKKIERVAEDLFKEHLDRAEKFGGRTRKAIIYDTYVNPKIDVLSVSELLDWYKKYNLQFYSSWPPVIPPVLADDLGGLVDWSDFPELLSRPEWIWATQISNDTSFCEKLDVISAPRSSSFRALSEKFNDVETENLDVSPMRSDINQLLNVFSSTDDIDLAAERNFKDWLKELDQLLASLEKKNYEQTSRILKNSKYLFRGKSGVGLTYFAAIKKEEQSNVTD